MDVPQARRVTRPTWINGRTVLGLLLFAVAFLAGLRVLEGSSSTVGVWAAARDLGADTQLGPDDLVLVDVNVPDELLSRYTTDAHDLTGSVLTRPIPDGELIPADALAGDAVASTGRSMTIPITPEHANGGRLAPGDRIDVFATFDAGDPRARSIVVLRATEVLDVVTAGGLVSGQEATVGVTVAVTPDEAVRLAFAVRSADIDIAKVTGAAGVTGTSAVRASDFD